MPEGQRAWKLVEPTRRMDPSESAHWEGRAPGNRPAPTLVSPGLLVGEVGCDTRLAGRSEGQRFSVRVCDTHNGP